MTISTPTTIDQIFSSAYDLCEQGTQKMGTGYLLLAVLTGNGAAAKTLTLRGLSPSQVRGAIRELSSEPEAVLSEVRRKAFEYAKTLRITSPSAIHLLAALATVKSCHGHKILKSAGLDTNTIRNQALRNMTTGMTREHGTSIDFKRHRFQQGPISEKDKLLFPIQNTILKDVNKRVDPRRHDTRRDAPKRIQSNSFQTPKVQADGGNKLVKPRRRAPKKITPTARDMGQHLENIQRKAKANQGPIRPGKSKTSPDTQTHSNHKQLMQQRFELDKKELPLLSSIGRNLTLAAALGTLDTIVGRTTEMAQLADVLNKRKANCPCIVGQSGVGKTALVEGLAQTLANDCAPGLRGQIVVELKAGDLLSGTSLRGALAERIDQLKTEVESMDGQVILFLDEIHNLLSSNDGSEAVQEFKTALTSGNFPCIFATSLNDYKKYIETDPALDRRMTVVEIKEPSQDETLEIMAGIVAGYEQHHQIAITNDAVSAAVRLSARYIADQSLPDKAIGLLDLACARARRFEHDAVTCETVAEVLAERINVPKERLVASDKKRLLDLESDLSSRIIGHSHVLTALGETLRRNAAGFRSGRPIGSFLFLGPTGVGKTETAKALCELLFADESAMIRLDMSEFAEPHAVARLVGAPPGYVGHEEGGQLTEAVKRRPYSLVLLDEIEKAHRDVIQTLLQVLDDGRLTDGKGQTIVFENTVIVMTSNLGSDLRNLTTSRKAVGFGAKTVQPPKVNLETQIIQGARSALSPELWNRIDEPLVFKPLNKIEVGQIARLMLSRIEKQLQQEHNVHMAVEQSAIDTLIDAGGYDAQLGARPMRRIIQRLVEGPVAKLVLGQDLNAGDSLTMTGNKKNLTFKLDCNKSA